MLKPNFALLTTGVFAASLGACGGGSAKAGDASTGADGPAGIDGRIIVDAGPAWDGAHPGDFISADVDGVTYRAEFEPSSGTIGVIDGWIWAVAGKTSKLNGWNVYTPNQIGTSECPNAWVALFEIGPTLRSDNPGGSCSVTVTAAAPALGDVVEGTFTAMLTGSTPGTAVVTNGAFHVTRDFQ